MTALIILWALAIIAAVGVALSLNIHGEEDREIERRKKK